jgi:hypothetical protein
MTKQIYIEWEEYERVFHEWVMSIFKKITDVDPTKFDKAIGIKYIKDDDNDPDKWHGYIFEVVDEQKFMLAIIKFLIKFEKAID